jgi:hypothetical protein
MIIVVCHHCNNSKTPRLEDSTKLLSVLIKAVTTDQLSAAFRAIFLIAIEMMFSTRRYIAIGTAKPSWKVKFFRVVGYAGKTCSIRVFDSRACFTSPDFRIRHFLLTDFTNSHKTSSETYINLKYNKCAIISSPDENVKGDSLSGEINSLAEVIIFRSIMSSSPLNW